ncbi:unnamed protein product [Ambrosiozyma monospora]|uniref:Unnamed protein product n=1 Tax=Ambrosiozyma monospora TaxID=43982 RepID=A0ACB5T2J1_AMBMO|nr:unnamed protein product [Ambrosiozyma monospora]
MSFDSDAGGFLRSKDYISTDGHEQIDDEVADDSVEDYLKYGATARPTNDLKTRPHHSTERVSNSKPKQVSRQSSDANSSDNSFASRLTQHLEKRSKHKRASDFYLPYMQKKNKITASAKKKNSMTELLSNVLDKDKKHTKSGSQDDDDDDYDMFNFRSSPAKPRMAVPNPLRSTSKHNQQPARTSAIPAQHRRSSGLFVKDSASSSSMLRSTPSKPSVSRSSTLQSHSRNQKRNNDMPPSSPINTALFSESTPMHVRGPNNGNLLSSSPVKRSAFPNVGSLQTFDLHLSKNTQDAIQRLKDRSERERKAVDELVKVAGELETAVNRHIKNTTNTKKDQVKNVEVVTIVSSESEDGGESEDSSADSDEESDFDSDYDHVDLEERLQEDYATYSIR